MKFQMPETLEGLTLDEISKLYEAALAEAQELNQIPDDKISVEQSKELVQFVAILGELDDRRVELEAESLPSADEIAAARAALAPKEEEPSGDGEDPDAGDGEDPDAGAEANAEEPAKELVAAGGRSFASRAANRNGEPADPPADPMNEARSQALSIVAAANIRGFSAEQELTLDELAQAYVNRTSSFAGGGRGSKIGRKTLPKRGTYGGQQLSRSAERFAIARLNKPENEFTILEKMSAEDQFDMIRKAASEKRLGGGSLVAAGGWCAPSEQVWGFLELESADGLLSIPEVTSRRGGIQYTKGPQLGDLLLETNLGWVQTETEAEAGEVKPIYDIECPDWDEIRMVAAGFALRAGLLTNTAYPELVRRYLGLAMIVHARRMNALTIGRISTAIGAATTFASVGATPSVTADLLSAIELQATRIRELYSMPINSTVEGIMPLWAPMVIRADLSRRTGVDFVNVTDQQINAWFAQRKIAPQFVRDYQPINSGAANTPGGTAGWTRLPDKIEFMLYPAGSFVRLGVPVIDLDAVYDTDNLTKNQFLAAFVEEGFEVANTGGSGVKVIVNLPNVFGATGFPAVGAGAGVTFATPTP